MNEHNKRVLGNTWIVLLLCIVAVFLIYLDPAGLSNHIAVLTLVGYCVFHIGQESRFITQLKQSAKQSNQDRKKELLDDNLDDVQWELADSNGVVHTVHIWNSRDYSKQISPGKFLLDYQFILPEPKKPTKQSNQTTKIELLRYFESQGYSLIVN